MALEIIDYGETSTGTRFYVKGVEPNSNIEKVIMQKLNTNEKSKAGAIKTNTNPYQILLGLGLEYTITNGGSSSNNSSRQNHNSSHTNNSGGQSEEIWWSKDSGESLIYVKKAILKDNADLRNAFKAHFNLKGENFNKDTSTWIIKPTDGLTHTQVQAWFEQQQNGYKNPGTENNKSCADLSTNLTISITPDTAKALKLIADALKDSGTVHITVQK